MTNNPSKQVYSAVMDYILSNAEIAGTFKAVNITRYDTPTHNKYPFKQELAPADLPDLIVQLTGCVSNRHSSCEYIEIYSFQATITTGDWTLDQATTAHVLMDWMIEGNYNLMNGIDFGEGYNFFKCEVMPMQIANQIGRILSQIGARMATNSRLSKKQRCLILRLLLTPALSCNLRRGASVFRNFLITALL